MLTSRRIFPVLSLTVLCICVLPLYNVLKAQGNVQLTVGLSKTTFNKGDTIAIEASLAHYSTIAKAATLQLWVEHIPTGKKWKFRYPLINGYIQAKLAIGSGMQEGVYAFTFMLQKNFFSLNGQVANAGKKDQVLNYAMISKARQTMLDIAQLNEQKEFSIRNLLFQDTAFIIFSQPGKKNNNLQIKITTPLDSAFTPLASVTRFITVGHAQQPITVTDTAAYKFEWDDTKYKIVLPQLVLTSRSNKRVQDFDTETSTGSFAGSDAVLLDGISSDEIANAPDLYLYLTKKIGGLRIQTDDETGNRSFVWRNQPTEIYINEIRLDAGTPLWINPADVAMIKVFRPGTQLMADAAAGGAIAIYTKRGQYRQDSNRNYSFYILGYTAMESVWK